MSDVFDKLKKVLRGERTAPPAKMRKGAFDAAAAATREVPRPALYRELSDKGQEWLDANIAKYGPREGEKKTAEEFDAWEAAHPTERVAERDSRYDYPGDAFERIGDAGLDKARAKNAKLKARMASR